MFLHKIHLFTQKVDNTTMEKPKPTHDRRTGVQRTPSQAASYAGALLELYRQAHSDPRWQAWWENYWDGNKSRPLIPRR
jgi:hypothetical protein